MYRVRFVRSGHSISGKKSWPQDDISDNSNFMINPLTILNPQYFIGFCMNPRGVGLNAGQPVVSEQFVVVHHENCVYKYSSV